MRDGYDNRWMMYPNPVVVDKDELLEVLGEITVQNMEYDDQEVFADWYRLVPESVRAEAALEHPDWLVAAELYSYNRKDAYDHIVDRCREIRRLRREIVVLSRENERLRHEALYAGIQSQMRRKEEAQ